MKTILWAFCLSILAALSACDSTQRTYIPAAGSSSGGYIKHIQLLCLDGVGYFYNKSIESAASMTVKFNRDGTVSTCEEI
jgi:hypothetical protein